MVDLALEVVPGSDDERVSGSRYGLAIAQAGLGDFEKALAHAATFTGFEQWYSYEQIAVLQAQAGWGAEAVRIFSLITDPEKMPSAATEIIEALANNGDLKNACALLQGPARSIIAKDKLYFDLSRAKILSASVEHGDWVETERLIEELAPHSAAVRCHGFLEIADAQCKKGNLESARLNTTKAAALLPEIDISYRHQDFPGRVRELQLKTEDQKNLDVLTGQAKPSEQIDARGILVRKLIRENDFAGLQRVFDSTEGSLPRAWVLWYAAWELDPGKKTAD